MNKYKTEFFLIFSILSAFFLPQMPVIHLISAMIILKLFLKNKSFLLLAVLLIVSSLASEYSLLIIDQYPGYGKTNSYRSTKGIYKTENNISVGTIIIGTFDEEDRNYYKIIKDKSSSVTITLPVVSSIINFRNDFSDRIYYLSGGQLQLPQALLMGNKSYLSTDIKDKFTILGLNHLLAVSGMHVGLILFIIYSFTLKLPKKMRFLILVILLMFFAPLAGLKIPVLRAVFFSSTIMIALFLDTKTDIKKLLLFTAGIFLLLSPSTLTDASFILSFSAVFGIVYLMEHGYGKIMSLLVVGFVATAFTLPTVLYMFGTFNILAIINTVIMLPFIYLLLTTTIFGLFFTKLSIAPLIFLEGMTKQVADLLIQLTSFAFVMHKIDISMVVIIVIILMIALYFKRIWLISFVFIIPFLPVYAENGIYIPNLKRSKCFIQKSESNAIFFQGQYSDFKYKVLPFIATLGINSFDSGQVRVFGGKNNFIKIKQVTDKFDGICINSTSDNCSVIFITKSNTLKKSEIDNQKKYIIYKNYFESDNIYQISQTGKLFISEGKFDYENKDK